MNRLSVIFDQVQDLFKLLFFRIVWVCLESPDQQEVSTDKTSVLASLSILGSNLVYFLGLTVILLIADNMAEKLAYIVCCSIL